MKHVLTEFIMNKFLNIRLKQTGLVVVFFLSMSSVICLAEERPQLIPQASSTILGKYISDSFFENIATEYVYSARLGKRTFFTLRTLNESRWNGLWEKRDDKMFLIKSFVDVGELVANEDTLYFLAQDNEFGAELWKSDGTQQGTLLAKDINLGLGGSEPNYLTQFNLGVLFFAKDSQDNVNLWYSEGSVETTLMVKHIQFKSFSKPIKWDWKQGVLDFYQVIARRMYADEQQADLNFILIEPTMIENAMTPLLSIKNIGHF